MVLNDKQLVIKDIISSIAPYAGVSTSWALAVAMTESSLGLNQKSPTGCKGVYQMSSIAMKDLLQAMTEADDDVIDVLIGLAFLRLLLHRHKTVERATEKFCDPKDRGFYVERVLGYMNEFKKEGGGL